MGVSGVAWSGVCVEWLESSLQGRMPESQSALVIRPRSSKQKSLPASPAWLGPASPVCFQGWPPESQSAPASASSGSSRVSRVACRSRNRLW
ncbi:hypothetical protein PF010_g23794 [Phytophthora fragariae]|uniref:Uncharacterized protein n=1 Tax=Phytophthora fragariae TaxID=53985 RepID=A0A6G0K4L0_9STRA|nr:hypothetical protein PF010_g23794 [Phytophthora fragariae]